MPADAFPGGLRYPDSSRRRRNELLNVAWGALRKRRMLWVMETTGLRRRSRECKKADASALRREQSLAHPPSRPQEHGEESGATQTRKKTKRKPNGAGFATQDRVPQINNGCLPDEAHRLRFFR